MKPKPTDPIMDLAGTHANLPPPPSPSFSALPTEILLLIVEQLHLDAKGPDDQPPTRSMSERNNSYNTPMNEAINALAGLSRTCRRLNEIVKPFLYEEPFLLQGNCLNRDIQGVYSFIRILAEENGLADLVRVYRAPQTKVENTKVEDSLRTFLDRCDLERYPLSMSAQELQSYSTLMNLINKYIPFLSKMAHKDSWFLDVLNVLTDLIPVVMVCHCRNLRRLDHLTIFRKQQFLWRDTVPKSVAFPNLEAANLEASTYVPPRSLREVELFIYLLNPIEEVVSFVNRAPNLRHLTLTAFSSSDKATVSIHPLENLSSLELHYCAFLRPGDLLKIIRACPRLERFVFTSEASPTIGRARPFDFPFLGPARILFALRPVSQQLKALSIEYVPLIDTLFNNEPNNMGVNDYLIQTIGYFPNLKVLRICHSALQRAPERFIKEQFVRLVKGCPRLESLDITQIDIREVQLRPQLEGLTAAVASRDTTPWLKGIRVGLDNSDWNPGPWTRHNFYPYLSDLFAKDHLDTYSTNGHKASD